MFSLIIKFSDPRMQDKKDKYHWTGRRPVAASLESMTPINMGLFDVATIDQDLIVFFS